MNVKWHGLSCITVKDKSATVLIDPHTVGMNIAKMNPDLVLTTEDIDVENGEWRSFTWPGEYEAHNVSVQIRKNGERSLVVFEINKKRFCHLGSMNQKLSDELIEKIGDIDVLFVPVGDGDRMFNYKEAVDVVEDIEPRCVIPINYKSEKFGEDLATNEAFLKEMSISNAEPQKSFDFTTLAEDRTEYVVLSEV